MADTKWAMASPWRASVILVLLAAAASAAFAGRAQRKMRDFEVYWTAGARALAAEPLYRADDGHYRFKYLPGFAIAMSPLARLPLPNAKVAWFTFSVACLVLFVILATASVPCPAYGRVLIGTLTTIALAKFFAHELVLGQANLLFGLLCAAALVLLLGRRDATSGGIFGAAVLVKPYAIVFVPYLLLIRRWRAAAVSCAASLLVLFVPIPVFGLDGTRVLMAEWWRTASDTSVPLLTNADSVSVFAMYAKWFGWGTAAAVLSGTTLAALAAAFIWAICRRANVVEPAVLEVGLLLTLIPLATPQGWDYALLLSAPLVALLLARFPVLSRAEQIIAAIALSMVAFSLYDVMGRAAYGAFMSLAIITVCYLVLMTIAFRLRARGAA